MNIILLLPSLDLGGAERQAVLTANSLAEDGHDVSMVIFKGGGELTETLQRDQVKLVLLAVTGPISAIQALTRLTALTTRGSVDVIYSFLPPSNLVSGFVGLLNRRLRVVWGVRSSIMPMHIYSWKLRALYWLEMKLIWMAHGIITNSLAGQAKVPLRLKQDGRSIVVPNAIDTNCFFKDRELRDGWRRKHLLNPETIAIGIIARLDPVKDHFTFVRAASKFVIENKKSMFFVIGDGDPAYRSTLELFIKKIGMTDHFIFTGAISNMNGAYNMLDIAALTSVSEGFPNAVGEAMATETPCTVTDVGDCGYLVGDPDLVCPVGDDEALSSIWLRLTDIEYRKAKGKQAQQRATEKFTIGKCCGSTIDFLVGS